MAKLHYLGHAGFCLEADGLRLVMDPWLSHGGAFDGAWFPLPDNAGMEAPTRRWLSEPGAVLTVSHAHEDHLDQAFLRSLPDKSLPVVLADYRWDDQLPALFREMGFTALHLMKDKEAFPLPGGGTLRLHLDQGALNRDAGFQVDLLGRRFLNTNDAKLGDSLEALLADGTPVDYFACQFSGATWHPTCYEYEPTRRLEIADLRVKAKFLNVQRMLDRVRPTVYLPSAGPACFLDETLFHHNFDPGGIFPGVAAFQAHLEAWRPEGMATRWPELFPGDALDWATGELVPGAREGGDLYHGDFRAYLEAYAGRRRPSIEARKRTYTPSELEDLRERLRAELAAKLEAVRSHLPLAQHLYLGFLEGGDLVHVDFSAGRVALVPEVAPGPHYRILAPAWQLERVLDRRISWENFSLTFRSRISRVPDQYDTYVNAFVWSEVAHVGETFDSLRALSRRKERMVVACGGRRYEADRICPHQGADLSTAHVDEAGCLVCPKHGWRFDLPHGGRTNVGAFTLHATPLEDTP